MTIAESQKFIQCKRSVSKRRKNCMKRSQRKYTLEPSLHQVSSVSTLLKPLSDLDVTACSIASQMLKKGGNVSSIGYLFRSSLRPLIEHKDSELQSQPTPKD